MKKHNIRTVVTGVALVIALVLVLVFAIIYFKKPAVPTPLFTDGVILEDYTTLFMGEKGTVCVLSASATKDTTLSFCPNFCSSYDTVILQGIGEESMDVCYQLVTTYPVKNLYVHKDMDRELLKKIQKKRPDLSVVTLTSSRHFVVNDMLLSVGRYGESSVALSFVHGNQSFLYASEAYKKAGDFTYAIMPGDALANSDKLHCKFAILSEGDDKLSMMARAEQLVSFYDSSLLFVDDGGEISSFGL